MEVKHFVHKKRVYIPQTWANELVVKWNGDYEANKQTANMLYDGERGERERTTSRPH